MKLTLEKLAQLTGGKILRSGSRDTFTGVASLLDADPEEISFLGNEKYFQDFLQTSAGVVIVPPGLPRLPSEEVALIEVPGNPSVAFNAAVKFFLCSDKTFTPSVHPSAAIDPTAVYNPDKVIIGPHATIGAHAVIGDGTEIGPGCTIGDSVVMGQSCRLFSNVVIRERCRLGDRVVIQPNATIGADGFGYLLVEGRYVGIEQAGIVELGNDVEIGANTTIDRARFGKTVIGEGTKIDNLVQIGHNCVIGKHVIIVSQSGIAGSTRIGDYVTIAAQCGIAGHLKLGDGLTLATRTGVPCDLEGGRDKIYWGMPATSFKQAGKQYVAQAKLPDLIKEVRQLKKELDALKKNS